ncbi:ADP-ribosylation factor family protein [Protomyces lactucae-debilis]|uniref:ADP-ribosylation factor family protein n=1 Tax=Protomyces lactucae-debilis TaxID=2754530 RepID=A0A1Y2F0K2_PROLT|nr:ADP-ribosylation factor family protein [Protomyces lactucae-debilis]ORY77412.1 ADP-ribosylation factor family protein [Protomyces lactucae-debilis]
MWNPFKAFWNYLLSLLWATEMEVTLVGLQNSGKSTLLHVLAGGVFTEDTIPTVGFNMRKVTKGRVTMKCWDLGGQPRFRSMWERYCRNVTAIVFVVDSADASKLATAGTELHGLVRKDTLKGIPLLVLANKNDLPGHLTVDEVIEKLGLSKVEGREVSCYSISVKEGKNLDCVVEWLMRRGK